MTFEMNAGKAATGFNAIERGIWVPVWVPVWVPIGRGLGPKKQRKI
jgi:hypothetical protein